MAERGISLHLFEMRPGTQTPAHQTGRLAELVCSNSLKSNLPTTASGLLKCELRTLGSLILRVAEETAVPAGSALAVDRQRFAARVTEVISEHPRIRVVREEVKDLPRDVPLVVASGPLTSEALSRAIQDFFGDGNLYFYDAIAPIIAADSLNNQKIFLGSRYQKGQPAYLNCPLNKSEYLAFYQELVAAETTPLHHFEEIPFFQGCMPVEELARRGIRTLLFGPMKAVGLTDPQTGRRPYAVLQLRQDNAEATIYNMVGFQTRLRRGEQRRVFRLIPGLEQAEFLRYGSIHRNSFLCAPRLLEPTLQIRGSQAMFAAGQITGGEGYVESVATGMMAGLNLARVLQGHRPVVPPRTSALGSLCRYIAESDADRFQPMNVNLGLLPPLDNAPRNREQRNEGLSQRALRDLSLWMEKEGIQKGAQRRGSRQKVSDCSSLGEELL
jgi:methylenetetrahydrofolate--tRNA-(uracil-5-)-methyltransferase